MMSVARKQIQIKFCACAPNDQVRLIQAGYFGGSPERPKTAISIRLVRFFHLAWKHCTVAYAPFSKLLNEFLDPAHLLILTGNNMQVSLHLIYLSTCINI